MLATIRHTTKLLGAPKESTHAGPSPLVSFNLSNHSRLFKTSICIPIFGLVGYHTSSTMSLRVPYDGGLMEKCIPCRNASTLCDRSHPCRMCETLHMQFRCIYSNQLTQPQCTGILSQGDVAGSSLTSRPPISGLASYFGGRGGTRKSLVTRLSQRGIATTSSELSVMRYLLILDDMEKGKQTKKVSIVTHPPPCNTRDPTLLVGGRKTSLYLSSKAIFDTMTQYLYHRTLILRP